MLNFTFCKFNNADVMLNFTICKFNNADVMLNFTTCKSNIADATLNFAELHLVTISNMNKDMKELVNKALNYDKQACLELAAWYREQGNARRQTASQCCTGLFR